MSCMRRRRSCEAALVRSDAVYRHCIQCSSLDYHQNGGMNLYLAGLLSHLDRKNAETIAALVDVERLVLQESLNV
jgi:hypothetical protein